MNTADHFVEVEGGSALTTDECDATNNAAVATEVGCTIVQ